MSAPLEELLETVLTLFLAILPLIIILWVWSFLAGNHWRGSIEAGRKSKDDVLETTVSTTSTCHNCGINEVDSDEPWEVCSRCRKDPSWWMGVEP